MPMMAVTFMVSHTVINLWSGERVETVQNMLAILILSVLVCNILASPKKNIPAWICENMLVIIYFTVRVMTLAKMGFDYSTIRTIFFEAFFLIGITKCTVGDSCNRSLYIRIFVWLELILTAASLLIYYLHSYLGAGIYDSLMEFTYLEKSGNALIFANPNTAGLMAGFAAVMAIMCYKKDIMNDRFLIIYGAYNVVALLLFGCRSAYVGLILVVCVLLFSKIFPKIKGRTIAMVISVLMVLTLLPIYGSIIAQAQPEIFTMTSMEKSIDDVSSGRYVIWKQCYHVHRDDFLLGNGSLKLEQEARQQFMAETDIREGADLNVHWDFVEAKELGPHNGYVAMLSCTGLLGMLLFFAVVLHRMKRSKSLDSGKWYLMLVFIFAANCFENLFVLNRFFICFYMFLLLAIDFNCADRKGQPSLEGNK